MGFLRAWFMPGTYFHAPTEAFCEEGNVVAFSPVTMFFETSSRTRCQKFPEAARGGRALGQSRVFPMNE